MMRDEIQKLSRVDLEKELQQLQADFFTTTSQAEHTWQPIEKHGDTSYRKKKNEFSVFVEASFQGGVFTMPLLDPPERPEYQQMNELEKNAKWP